MLHLSSSGSSTALRHGNQAGGAATAAPPARRCLASGQPRVRHHHHHQLLPAQLSTWGQQGHHTSCTCAASGSGSSDSAGGGSSAGPLGLLRKWRQDSRRLQEQLKALGVAGIIAYGLFNTLYYTCAFLFVWLKWADVPSGAGWAPVTAKAAEVLALVWAGSQVTKLLRAGAALACAPLIDRGLEALGLQDKRKAYVGIVLGCIGLALGVMGVAVAVHV